MRQPSCVGFGAAVEGRDCKIDVLSHGVVADTIAIWDDRAKAHDAVRLCRDLEGGKRERNIADFWFQVGSCVNRTKVVLIEQNPSP